MHIELFSSFVTRGVGQFFRQIGQFTYLELFACSRVHNIGQVSACLRYSAHHRQTAAKYSFMGGYNTSVATVITITKLKVTECLHRNPVDEEVQCRRDWNPRLQPCLFYDI